ncbi:ABC transporter ATP-binding protein [Halobacteria archaeon AArc-dxtr1]|nr:ABC transporter ATP-binding protein [Halobacteria archaeon AArc-dxtr1]
MILDVDSLTHRYGAEPVVEDVSFGLDTGEFGAILGPSGCGKTTIVQAIAGHVRPTGGRVRLRGTDVTDDPPESRRVGIVFQRSTLYPHMTVRENVAYGLAAHDVPADERPEIVSEYLDLVALADRHDAYPAALSGGQRRRVELARALAPQPEILLLDEPLSALDRGLRERLREEIARIQRETDVTTLLVTHDQEEAMALADRLVVLHNGRVAGIGEPRALYESPPTPFVGSFLGRSNALSAIVVDRHPLVLALGDREVTVPEAVARPPGTSVTCHVRPQDLSLVPGATDETVSLPGTIVRVRDLGSRYDVTVRIKTGDELVVERTANPPAVGDSCTVSLPVRAVTVFDSEQTAATA